jgi:hypothetical protein
VLFSVGRSIHFGVISALHHAMSFLQLALVLVTAVARAARLCRCRPVYQQTLCFVAAGETSSPQQQPTIVSQNRAGDLLTCGASLTLILQLMAIELL